MPVRTFEARVRHHQPRVVVVELHGEINAFAEEPLAASYAACDAASGRRFASGEATVTVVSRARG